MTKIQKVFYWTGVVSGGFSAYNGLKAMDVAYSISADGLIEIAHYLRPVGHSMTALAFAVLALVCFKAAEMNTQGGNATHQNTSANS